MRLEAGKEMDRKCVLDWLNEVYVTPSLSYSNYTDEEIRIFAHDALVLLKEQEAVKPEKEHSGSGITWWNVCGNCKTAINPNDKYCHECGREVRWE